jgi:hypothetical protein
LDATGHFAAVVIIECPDDQTAMIKANEIFAARPGFHGIELWDLNRWVHPNLDRLSVPVGTLG